MGALIATVVVGVIIALFGLKIVRVLSALVGLAVGAVIGATVGVIAGFDMTKMLVAVAVCAVILCVMCAALRCTRYNNQYCQFERKCRFLDDELSSGRKMEHD